MVLSTWLGAFGALVPTLLELWGTFGLDPTIGSCTILPDRDGNSPKEFLFVFAFVLPCVAICVCYARIFFIVHRADKKSHSSGQRILKVNGKRKKPPTLTSPYRGAPAPPALHAAPLNDRLQRETRAKLSSSKNSVRVEIVEPDKEGEQPRPKDGTNSLGLDVGVKIPRTPSPDITPGDAPTDACSLLRTEVNGFSGHTSQEGGVPLEASCSPIRICPPSAPDSPVSVRSEDKPDGTTDEEERTAATISGKGNAFSQLRGTFKRTRAGSFISRQPNLSAKDRRLLKMILVIFMSFVACYLPITLVKTFSKDDNPVLNILGLLLIYMTTCINPIIYVVMSSEYRQAYVSLLTCKRDVDPSNRSVTKIS